ncbi:patatin-like phospholipase family protein [Bauldia sp.]|uniref:patatin-like phospholipase family protein n=1 Tax=Bauldia sp. TaxID=2575872 RepID=UPI003BA8CD42
MTVERFGLALSGGGARGFAHIPVLEALDEMGVRPSIITGTSIGAIMGAGYAAGMSGADIRDYAVSLFTNRTEVLSRLWRLRPKRVKDWFTDAGPAIGQIDARRTMETFLPEGLPLSFDDLRIPLKVVATDFYGWDAASLETGPLHPALAASAALPIVFRPVRLAGRVLIDGGITNPLPFDLIEDDVDLVMAVDVVGGPVSSGDRLPGSMEAMFGATQLLMQSLMAEKMRGSRPPDILIRPPVGARVLEFLKVRKIVARAEPAKDEVKRLLDRALSASVVGG